MLGDVGQGGPLVAVLPEGQHGAVENFRSALVGASLPPRGFGIWFYLVYCQLLTAIELDTFRAGSRTIRRRYYLRGQIINRFGGSASTQAA